MQNARKPFSVRYATLILRSEPKNPLQEGNMKRIGIMVLSVVVMLGALASGAAAQKTFPLDYRAQLEAALGGKIIAVQRNAHYPATSLTQAVDLTVARADGRTDVVPVQIVFVKASGGYVVQSMYILNTSPLMANQRATQLPTPSAGTMGGGGGGTGTSSPTSTQTDECKTKCFSSAGGGPIDWVKAAACYLACRLGLPIPLK
jgi:hypothetical protein